MTRVQQLVRFFWLEQMSKMVKQHTATQQCSQKCAPKQFHFILFHTLHMRIGQKLLVGLCGAFICGAFSICVVTSLLGISGTHPEQQPELPAL